MVEQKVSQELKEAIDSLRSTHRRYRLILLVGPPGPGEGSWLSEMARTLDCPLINVNLEVSKRLQEVPRSRHPRKVSRMMEQVVTGESEVLFLDHLELLFDPSLALDPLYLLEHLSRNRILVARWNGTQDDDGKLIYAEPDHPEYREYREHHAHIISF